MAGAWDPGRTLVARDLTQNLRVLHVSIFDDQIRRAAANAIYRDAMFTAYAIEANPPIHICGERKRGAERRSRRNDAKASC